MRIKGMKTEKCEVEVPEGEIMVLLEVMLIKRLKLPEGSFIRDGKIFYNEERHTSHSWTETIEVNNVTDQQVALLQAWKSVVKFMADRNFAEKNNYY